jgi:hypothetical protein
MNVLDILEVRHGTRAGMLEFKLRVMWPNKKVEIIDFTYDPDDDAPLTVGLREKIVPTLDPSTILPARVQ